MQFVATQNTAFGNGILVRPTDPRVVSRLPANPNSYTISIEHELKIDEIPTDAQYAASAKLLKFLNQKWDIPLTRERVIPHYSINGAKTCPNKVDMQHLLGLCIAD